MTCEDPIYIINPNYLKYSSLCDCLYIPNKVINLSKTGFNPYYWHPKRLKINHDNYAEYYFSDGYIDPIAGINTKYPLYLEVPCGHCALCRERKSKEWSTRTLMESNMYDTPPAFITLTYTSEPVSGVNKEDVQLWLKRLRIRLSKAYNIDTKLRYILSSEYGHKTHRAHYHALVWGLPSFSEIRLKYMQAKGLVSDKYGMYIDKNGYTKTYKYAPYHYVNDIISETWQHGITRTYEANGGASTYVTKYMRKDCFVPTGKNPVFFLASKRHGGIGAAYIDTNLIPYFRAHPLEIKYQIPYRHPSFDQKTQTYFVNPPKNMILSGYIRNRVFPTLSRFYDISYKNMYISLLEYSHSLNQDAHDVIEKYDPHNLIYTPFRKSWYYTREVIDQYTAHAFELLLDDYLIDHSKVYNLLVSRGVNTSRLTAYAEALNDAPAVYQKIQIDKKINISNDKSIF